MDPAFGSGWLSLVGKNRVEGKIKLHLGDSFLFWAERITGWDALFGRLGLMPDHDRAKFEKVALTLAGRKRPYINPDQSLLRAPQLIPQTNLFAETNLSSQMIVGICYSLVRKMGLNESQLAFEIY